MPFIATCSVGAVTICKDVKQIICSLYLIFWVGRHNKTLNDWLFGSNEFVFPLVLHVPLGFTLGTLVPEAFIYLLLANFATRTAFIFLLARSPALALCVANFQIKKIILQRLPVTRALQQFFSISKTKFWWTSIKCMQITFHNNWAIIPDPTMIEHRRETDTKWTRLLSWIHLIDVHQNTVFEMGKNHWRSRVTDNRCKRKPLVPGYTLGNFEGQREQNSLFPLGQSLSA